MAKDIIYQSVEMKRNKRKYEKIFLLDLFPRKPFLVFRDCERNSFLK